MSYTLAPKRYVKDKPEILPSMSRKDKLKRLRQLQHDYYISYYKVRAIYGVEVLEKAGIKRPDPQLMTAGGGGVPGIPEGIPILSTPSRRISDSEIDSSLSDALDDINELQQVINDQVVVSDDEGNMWNVTSDDWGNWEPVDITEEADKPTKTVLDITGGEIDDDDNGKREIDDDDNGKREIDDDDKPKLHSEIEGDIIDIDKYRVEDDMPGDIIKPKHIPNTGKKRVEWEASMKSKNKNFITVRLFNRVWGILFKKSIMGNLKPVSGLNQRDISHMTHRLMRENADLRQMIVRAINEADVRFTGEPWQIADRILQNEILSVRLLNTISHIINSYTDKPIFKIRDIEDIPADIEQSEGVPQIGATLDLFRRANLPIENARELSNDLIKEARKMSSMLFKYLGDIKYARSSVISNLYTEFSTIITEHIRKLSRDTFVNIPNLIRAVRMTMDNISEVRRMSINPFQWRRLYNIVRRDVSRMRLNERSDEFQNRLGFRPSHDLVERVERYIENRQQRILQFPNFSLSHTGLGTIRIRRHGGGPPDGDDPFGSYVIQWRNRRKIIGGGFLAVLIAMISGSISTAQHIKKKVDESDEDVIYNPDDDKQDDDDKKEDDGDKNDIIKNNDKKDTTVYIPTMGEGKPYPTYGDDGKLQITDSIVQYGLEDEARLYNERVDLLEYYKKFEYPDERIRQMEFLLKQSKDALDKGMREKLPAPVNKREPIEIDYTGKRVELTQDLIDAGLRGPVNDYNKTLIDLERLQKEGASNEKIDRARKNIINAKNRLTTQSRNPPQLLVKPQIGEAVAVNKEADPKQTDDADESIEEPKPDDDIQKDDPGSNIQIPNNPENNETDLLPERIDPAEAKLFVQPEKDRAAEQKRWERYSYIQPNHGLGSIRYNPLVRENVRSDMIRYHNTIKPTNKPDNIPSMDDIERSMNPNRQPNWIPELQNDFGNVIFEQERPEVDLMFQNHMTNEVLHSVNWREYENPSNIYNPEGRIHQYRMKPVIIPEIRNHGYDRFLPTIKPSLQSNIPYDNRHTGYEFTPMMRNDNFQRTRPAKQVDPIDEDHDLIMSSLKYSGYRR